MNRTGLLIVTNLARLRSTLQHSRQHVSDILFVQLAVPADKPALSVPRFGELINSVYAQTVHGDCPGLDVRVLLRPSDAPIGVLLLDRPLPGAGQSLMATIVGRYANVISLAGDQQTTGDACADFVLAGKDTLQATAAPDDGADNVVLGGTFDRLHLGHKMLISAAAIRARRRLVIGVTDASMVASKVLCELIRPVDERIRAVRQFVASIDAQLVLEAPPIDDMYGPTKSEPDMQMLVVSRETARGGDAVNRKRAENGLSQLHVHCIELVDDAPSAVDAPHEQKVSSSNRRMDLLGERLRPVKRTAGDAFAVALRAGGAVQLDVIVRRLRELHVNVVDAEEIGNGLPAGISVLTGKRLPDAYDEVWAVIVSGRELQARLAEQPAVDAQVATNAELVESASVVLSTQWNDDFTRQQVDKAVRQLSVELREQGFTFTL